MLTQKTLILSTMTTSTINKTSKISCINIWFWCQCFMTSRKSLHRSMKKILTIETRLWSCLVNWSIRWAAICFYIIMRIRVRHDQWSWNLCYRIYEQLQIYREFRQRFVIWNNSARMIMLRHSIKSFIWQAKKKRYQWLTEHYWS